MNLQNLMKVDARISLEIMVEDLVKRAEMLTENLPIDSLELCKLASGGHTKVLSEKLVVRLSKDQSEKLYQKFQNSQAVTAAHGAIAEANDEATPE